jgi:NAD(P)-dependent dehydrogenase (short-subunit alcohol dehydrogenase family)
MKIQGSVALVAGANRGLGAAFARGLLAAGAAKVYAAARDPASVTMPGVVPVRLDVTQPDQIAALALELTDLSLLVNNAGIGGSGPVLDPNAIDTLHRQSRPMQSGRCAWRRHLRVRWAGAATAPSST